MERLTKSDMDLGYYVDADLAREETWKNNRTGEREEVTQGEAISKLAELEDAIERGELVRVVHCCECRFYQTSACACKHERALKDFCSHGAKMDGGK